MDGPAFAAYVEKVLVPELSSGSIVICGQSCHSQKRWSGKGEAEGRMLVPVLASL